MSDKLPVIRSNSYGFEDDMLELTKEFFFDAETEDIAISTLKPSLFGFFSRSGGHIIKNGVHHRNAMHDEYFLNTASMDESIYSFAKFYTYQVENAKAAKASINVAFKESDLIAYSNINPNNSNKRIFNLSKDSLFNMEDFSFMLPNAIIIELESSILSTNVTSWSIKANYDKLNYNLPNLAINNPYIETWRQTIDGEKWFLLRLVVYQMEVVEYEYDQLSNDSNELLDYNISYEDQLCGFRVFNKESFNNNFWEIIHGEFNASTTPVDVENYYYYTYPSDNELQVYFGTVPDWRPRFGSTIKIRTFRTKGTKGNFTFNGPISITLKTSDEEIAAGQKDKSTMIGIGKAVSDSAGGVDKLSVKELKEELIKKSFTRDNLITSRDLEYFFNDTASENSVNKSTMMFVKKRDDFLRRFFSVYLFLKDKNNKVIPTNTIDISVDYSKLEAKNFVIKPGTIIIYDSVNAIYRFLEENEYIDSFLEDKYSIVYSVPYLLNIKLNPFPRIVHYRNSISQTKSLKFNNTPYFAWEVIINSVNISRNSLYEDFYSIKLNLNTNIDEYGISINEDPLSNYLKLRLIVKDLETKEVLFCVDLNKNINVEAEWYTNINTNDLIDDNGRLILESSDLSQLRDSTGSPIPYVDIPEKFDLEIAVMYDALGAEGNTFNYNQSIVSRERNPIYLEMIDLETDDSYFGTVVGFILEQDDYISFHRSLTEIIISNLIINSNASLILSNIGVIGARYFMNRDKSIEISNILNIYEDVIRDNLKSLENNTDLDIKFFNTYGISKYFTSDTTNLFIEMNVKLNQTFDTSLDADIKLAISDFVENSNKENKFPFSNLITYLENNFQAISYITIVGINSLGQQAIEKTMTKEVFEMNKDELVKYVPEMLNVNMETTNNKLEYSIKINYL